MLSFNYLSVLTIITTLGLISACSEQQANPKKTTEAVSEITAYTKALRTPLTVYNTIPLERPLCCCLILW